MVGLSSNQHDLGHPVVKLATRFLHAQVVPRFRTLRVTLEFALSQAWRIVFSPFPYHNSSIGMALPTIGDSIPSVKVQKRRYAPWYNIPSSSPSIVSIEHPFIVQNIDKGIQTLGGLSALLKARISCKIRHYILPNKILAS